MANLVIDPLKVRPVKIIEEHPLACEVAVTAGQLGKFSTTTGLVNLALGTTAPNAASIGMAMAGTAEYPTGVTFVRRGLVDVGDALNALAYGASVFLSDTPGTLADTAGTVSTIVGTVFPGLQSTTPDKLLRLAIV